MADDEKKMPGADDEVTCIRPAVAAAGQKLTSDPPEAG